MREWKVPEKTNNPVSPDLEQSIQTIHEFLDSFPAEHLEENSWELISSALTSEDADSWSARDRGNMLLLFKHLCKLGYALSVVDKQLWPLSPLEEVA